jgi:hypothetical protein
MLKVIVLTVRVRGLSQDLDCIFWRQKLSNSLLHISFSYAYMLVMSHLFVENSFFNNVFTDLCSIVFVYLIECGCNGVNVFRKQSEPL